MDYPIDDATALLHEGKFTNGNPLTALPPSPLKAQWLNNVYDELIHLITSAELEPDFNNKQQVLAAINALIGTATQPIEGLLAQALVNSTHRNPTRHCVLSGPNDGHINTRFLMIDGNTVKTRPSISTTPLRMCFSSGFDDDGEINHIVKRTTELVWSFSGAGPGRHYLYVLRNASTGEITTAVDAQGPVVTLSTASDGKYWYPLDHRSGGAINASFANNWLCVGQVDIVAGDLTDLRCVRYGYSVAQKTYSCRIFHSDADCHFVGDHPVGWTIQVEGTGNKARIYHNLGDSTIYHANATQASFNEHNSAQCTQTHNYITVGQSTPQLNFSDPMSPFIEYNYVDGYLSIVITVL